MLRKNEREGKGGKGGKEGGDVRKKRGKEEEIEGEKKCEEWMEDKI